MASAGARRPPRTRTRATTVANNWRLWEEQPGRIFEGQKCEKATDWWDLDTAAADFDRAAEMGLNALRISVEWSRIEPAPGEFEPGGARTVRARWSACCASAASSRW